jgi:uncharacterized OB-fold protein
MAADAEAGAQRPAGSAPRQLPALEPETAFFWTAGAEGRLLICHCDACSRYLHPPLPRCPGCGGETQPRAVSGKGRVAAYTVNVQPWLPGMKVPFVYAAVELAEQAELYVMTNITDCPVREVRRGLPVEVWFEQHEDVFLPMFRPTGEAHAG